MPHRGAPNCVSGRLSAKLLLGAEPILFMMSVRVAAFGPEPVRKLRNLFAGNRDRLSIRRGSFLFLPQLCAVSRPSVQWLLS